MHTNRSQLAQSVNSLAPLKKAWEYPILDAILQRRARRFPLGATMPGEVSPFNSAKEPVPLDEVEEALLVIAGTGISGMNLADLPFNDQNGGNFCGNTMVQFTGRTYASACGSHGTELFFTNDEGTYIVEFRDKTATELQEYASLDDREKIIEAFRANTVQIGEGRLPIPMVPGVTQPFNWWDANQPGSTLFMPVSDVTWEFINVLMLVMDEPNSFYPYDDLNDNAEPLKEWADKGYLDRSRPYPLSVAESRMAVGITGTEQALMLQNMYLTLQGMGLGGWLFSSSAGHVVLDLMGFRFQEVEKFGRLRPLNLDSGLGRLPVGLDNHFQSYRPPYYPDMSSAVQAIWDVKWGARGIYKENGAPSPLKDRTALDKVVQPTPPWCLDATKAMCEYIWETYGRFPAFTDPMQMNIWFQAHHLETDFYDTYYQPGAYPPTVRDHMAEWHDAK